MSVENLVGLILAAALIVFLVAALLFPDHIGERASRKSRRRS